MVLKLSPLQADALFNVFNHFVLPDRSDDPTDMLVLLTVMKVYRKLRTKMEAHIKTSYNLSLTLEEALAYHSYFHTRELAGWTFEQGFITTHIGQIHQHIKSIKN
jgi:hypothetical protein